MSNERLMALGALAQGYGALVAAHRPSPGVAPHSNSQRTYAAALRLLELLESALAEDG